MRFDQGTTKQLPADRGQVWQPERLRPLLEDVVLERLRYVVVDDIDAETVELLSYPWPHLAVDGSLVFDDTDPSDQDVRLDQAVEPSTAVWISPGPAATGSVRAFCQDRISGLRSASATLLAAAGDSPDAEREIDRPLRVGDTFAFYLRHPIAPTIDTDTGRPVLDVDLDSGIEWLVDISLEARQTAKAALFGAIAPPIPPEEAGFFATDEIAEAPPGVGEAGAAGEDDYEAEMRASEAKLRQDLLEKGIVLPGSEPAGAPGEVAPTGQQAFPAV